MQCETNSKAIIHHFAHVSEMVKAGDSGQAVSDHIAHVSDMIVTVKGAKREIKVIKCS